MKTKLTIALLVLMLCASCGNTEQFGIKKIELEGCEYYYNLIGESYTLTHKANCNNPEHLPDAYKEVDTNTVKATIRAMSNSREKLEQLKPPAAANLAAPEKTSK
jgi:hypothetical protein